MKPVSSKLLFAEVFRCIHTLFNAAYKDMECFNQLQMHIFWHFKPKSFEYWYLKNENRL